MIVEINTSEISNPEPLLSQLLGDLVTVQRWPKFTKILTSDAPVVAWAEANEVPVWSVDWAWPRSDALVLLRCTDNLVPKVKAAQDDGLWVADFHLTQD
jgi:hypothetical protein